MPDVNEVFPELATMNAAELEQRRRELVAKIGAMPVDDVPLEQLRELSALTAHLRRKSSGPPKAAGSTKKAAKGPQKKATVSDIFDQI